MFLKPIIGLNKVVGKPFKVDEIIEKSREVLQQKAVA